MDFNKKLSETWKTRFFELHVWLDAKDIVSAPFSLYVLLVL